MGILAEILASVFRGPPVDARVSLAQRAARNPETLNWQSSIVDLLKLIGRDSSLPSRRQLAKDYGYPGPLDGSAAMNTWLHSQVMARIESGQIRV